MKKITHVFGRSMVLAAVLSMLVVAAAAQTKPEAAGGGLMGVTMVTIKPDMSPEFRAFIKNEYNPALVKGGEKMMWTWQSAGFGDAFQYVFVAPMAKMAELDGPSPLEKGLGQDNMGAFFKKAGSMVTAVRSYAMAERQDLSYMAAGGGEPKMAVVVTMKANPGQMSAFESYLMNDFIPVFKKSDAKGMLMHQTIFGGDPNEFVMLVPIDNYADLDKGHPIARVVGMDGWRKMRDKMPGAVTDISIMRMVPSLSIMPPAAK